MVRLVSILLLSVTLIACASQAGNNEALLEATFTPSVSPNAEADSLTPTQTLDSASVEASEGLSTPIGPTRTPRPTRTPQPTLTPTSTPDFRSVFTESEISKSYVVSPDGKWVAHSLFAMPEEPSEESHMEYQFFAIEDRGGTMIWPLIDQWNDLTFGARIVVPYKWSADSRYFYYRRIGVMDTCGPYAHSAWISNLVNGYGLERVDVTTGETEVLLHMSHGAVLSPDETLVASAGYGVNIKNLSTGEEQQFALPVPADDYYDWLGDIVWSPDQSSLMVLFIDDACYPAKEQFDILRLDLASGQFATVIDSDPRHFVTMDWPSMDRVLLRDKDNNFWWMNPITGKLTPRD